MVEFVRELAASPLTRQLYPRTGHTPITVSTHPSDAPDSRSVCASYYPHTGKADICLSGVPSDDSTPSGSLTEFCSLGALWEVFTQQLKRMSALSAGYTDPEHVEEALRSEPGLGWVVRPGTWAFWHETEQEWRERPSGWGLERLPGWMWSQKTWLASSARERWLLSLIPCRCAERVLELRDWLDANPPGLPPPEWGGPAPPDTVWAASEVACPDSAYLCPASRVFRRWRDYYLRGLLTLGQVHRGSLDILQYDRWLFSRVGITLKDFGQRFGQRDSEIWWEVLGNPFRPVSVEPAWLAWSGGAVTALARGIRQDCRFEDLPLLADALEEAGCADESMLEHCRRPGGHMRGCWVIDLLLGKA